MNLSFRKYALIVGLFFLVASINSYSKTILNEIQANRDSISAEMQNVLSKEFALFYPLCIDSLHGGYFSDINYQWQLEGRQNKMIVTQARHVWAASNAAMFYQTDNSLRNIAVHGIEFLRNKMWDRQFGGFYDLVTREGDPIPENGKIIKSAYGNSFAIYGLASYYRTSGDTNALRFAQDAFRWLDKYSYDSQYGGYFQFLSRNGKPFIHGYQGTPPKDYNSAIHILECLTELYKVWPDSTLKERLASHLKVIRDIMITDEEYLKLYFSRDWKHLSYRDSSASVRQNNLLLDYISFGHDVETAYLMLEASETLGLKNDSTTLRIAKKMVDHVIKFGFDNEHGGLFDGGYYFRGKQQPTIVRNTKEWWSQAEALNSFLMMSELFPKDELNYYQKFCKQWDYCKQYVIDSEHGGWYWGGIDIQPEQRQAPKATIWKANYHTSRALINCINRLERGTISYDPAHYDPVNKNATPEAKKLLDYLYSINGKNIIAGHHNYITRPDTFINRVKELTGKSPEIYGVDFVNYYVVNYSERLVQEVYNKYKEGYIITLMWHAGRRTIRRLLGMKAFKVS